MKRICIFGKEFYIFSAQEHEDALNFFCGVEVGTYNRVSEDWIEKHVMSKGHIVDDHDIFAMRSVLYGLDYARKQLNPLKKAIGWSTQKIWES